MPALLTILTCLLLAPGAAAADDGAPPPLGAALPIEDPSGVALDALHEALARAGRGEGQARLLFFGASHVASDLFTGEVRRRLQARYGDAGHGFVLPAKPWKYYRHADVNLDQGRGWTGHRIRVSDTDIEPLGLAGAAVETSRRTRARVRTTTDSPVGRAVSRFEVWYLGQPGGGTMDILVDGRRVAREDTNADRWSAGYVVLPVEDGPHELEIRPRGDGAVRLFGVLMARDAPGVVVDTLGINGARARYQLLWEPAIFAEHLARRAPHLVVLAYGTNESGDKPEIRSIASYEADLRRVVARVRSTVPRASCVLIGPSDRPVRLPDDGGWAHRPRTDAVVEVQRRVSRELGCGFFDLVAYSGGPLSMVRWAAVDPPYGAPDHIHFTRRAYKRLGEVFTAALLPPTASATPAPRPSPAGVRPAP